MGTGGEFNAGSRLRLEQPFFCFKIRGDERESSRPVGSRDIPYATEMNPDLMSHWVRI